MQDEIHQWVGGAFTHTHPRLEDAIDSQPAEALTPEMQKYMRRYDDGSMTLEAITYYLDGIFGERIPITDTQHPSYVLHPQYDDLEDSAKVEWFNPNVVEPTIQLLSQCMLERMRVIRRASHLNHVKSGVEVDILSPRGRLSVNDEVLQQLDYVTCSFHSSLWRASGNPDPTKKVFLDTYQNIVANRNVDTISHPTFYLPPEVKQNMTASDWKELLQHMKEAQVAFEVNLDSTDLVHNRGNNLDRALIVSALKHEVPIVIGFDFHYPHDWGCYPSPRLLREKDAEALFQEHCQNGSISKLLARVLGNIYALKQLGLQPSDVLNHSQTSFNAWLSDRNLQK